MARWEPDASQRLAQAALQLFAERGYDSTTVALIAARAGLTERTFFRHNADKREVLFAGAHELEDRLVSAVRSAPSGDPPLAVLGAALAAASPVIDAHPDFARARAAVVAATPALQERELMKLSSLARALGAALQERGTAEAAATLAGETAVAVFKVAFDRWARADDGRSLAEVIAGSFDELARVAAESTRS